METFDDLEFGAKIEYVGPDKLEAPYKAPTSLEGPHSFRHVTANGTLTLQTRFNQRKYLSPDHPANNANYWK